MGPQLKVVERTRTATMLCAASGNPDPEITWYKDFLPIDPSASNGRIKQLRSGKESSACYCHFPSYRLEHMVVLVLCSKCGSVSPKSKKLYWEHLNFWTDSCLPLWNTWNCLIRNWIHRENFHWRKLQKVQMSCTKLAVTERLSVTTMVLWPCYNCIWRTSKRPGENDKFCLRVTF